MAKENSAFMKPMQISDDLAEVVGKGPMPRSEVVKNIWVYIKKHDLQDPANKRSIRPDAQLAKVFGTTEPVDMFKMTAILSKQMGKEAST